MSSKTTAKNYAEQGGARWVVEGELQLAGKLTDADGNEIEPGAGPQGPPGKDGKDGFPTEEEWNDLLKRVEALEGGGGS